MIDWEKENHQAKHQFRSYYCSACKQKKPCQLLSSERCCSCYYHQEKEKAQEIYELFASSLKEIEEKLKECVCESSPKPRTPYYDWKNYGYTYCEKCETTIKGAGKHGVIKNRNNPSFWGLEIKEKVLCLNCLQKFQEKMPISKQYTLNKYLKRGY